jgi:hypothetical protein
VLYPLLEKRGGAKGKEGREHSEQEHAKVGEQGGGAGTRGVFTQIPELGSHGRAAVLERRLNSSPSLQIEEDLLKALEMRKEGSKELASTMKEVGRRCAAPATSPQALLLAAAPAVPPTPPVVHPRPTGAVGHGPVRQAPGRGGERAGAPDAEEHDG